MKATHGSLLPGGTEVPARNGGRCVAVGWAAALLLLGASSHAQVLDVDHEQPRRGLAGVVRYLELPGTVADTLPQALALPKSAFMRLATRYIDPGPTPNARWILLTVRNPSARGGEWRLSYNVRFMTELLTYRRDGAGGRVLLDQRDTSTFAERPTPLRLLVVPLWLAAGETADLLIGYRSNGTTALPLSIETPQSFADRYAWETSLNVACYAAIGFLALLSVLQALTFAQPSQLSYAVYLGATLLYIAHMDGVTFQYFWPESPLWNSYAAIPLRLAMGATAVWFTRNFVQPKRLSPTLDKLMLGLIVLAAVLSAGWPFASEAALKGLAYLLTTISAAMCLSAAVVAHFRGRPATRFFTLGWLGVFAGMSSTAVVNNFSAVVAHTTAVALPKVTILFAALMFYMALAELASVWRLERDAAARREVDALRAQRKATDKLHQVERERLEALVLAQVKSRQLAMASHDIRQPLASLRLTAERLAQGSGAEGDLAHGLKQSLDYLQRLTDEYSSLPPGDVALSADSRPRPAKNDSFAVTTVLDNIVLMFREEAIAKGLGFRCRTVRAEASGDAMSAMRLVSNLVANAIKYTNRGKILVACRRRRGGLRIVVADTGPGMGPAELARVMRLRERGTAAEGAAGHGLGLGIASALAATSGYTLTCRSTPGKGTAFFIDFELASGY